MRSYLWSLFLILDEWVNVKFGKTLNKVFSIEDSDYKFGNKGEYLSYVFGKNSDKCSWCRRMCLLLHFFDKKHCSEEVIREESER